MMQEIERFRKTGKREKVSVNTRNVLFIMSGAFTDLVPIIQRRLSRQEIGFGARLGSAREQVDMLRHVKAEDLIEYGFESEFVGRLPVKAVLEHLSEEDLYQILRNPNNPIILGKKLDFAAYGIEVKFEDAFLRRMAALAFAENTGARGLVSVIEKALLDFERALPSSPARKFPVTLAVLDDPRGTLERMLAAPEDPAIVNEFERVADEERAAVRDHLEANRKSLVEKFGLGHDARAHGHRGRVLLRGTSPTPAVPFGDQGDLRRDQEHRAPVLRTTPSTSCSRRTRSTS